MKKYIFVNFITFLSLVLGIFAIYNGLHGYLYFSFGLILLAFITDSVDGYLARKFHAESHFGAIFDTIADIFVYLIYPAVVMFKIFGLNNLAGILSICIFLSTGILRLIRFTKSGFIEDGVKKYYQGMPVFFSHLLIIIFMIINLLDNTMLITIGPSLLFFMSVLMVSKIKFRKPVSIKSLIFILSTILLLSIIMFIL